tara:strand:- start:3450 stop:3677 length:228 start_codon:yes stop_codon:yes gene_type:complete
MGLVKWIIIILVLVLALIGAMTLFGDDSEVSEETETEFDASQVDTSDIDSKDGEELIIDTDLGDEESEVDIGEVI